MKTQYLSAALMVLSILGCNNEANNKITYELQEKCGKAATQWANVHNNEVTDYKSHYNSHLNKCFVLAELAPIDSGSFISNYYILQDINENNKYGGYTVRTYRDNTPVSYQCQIKDKYYSAGNGNNAKEKWDSFVKEIMAQ